MRRALLLALAMTAGCSEYDLTDFGYVDVFNQNPAEDVDILMVVDNSCSMSPYQARLGQNFSQFISWFVGANINYQIAVTTTSITDPEPSCTAAEVADIPNPGQLVDDVIITHLHYDHAGTLGSFPRATFHLQPAEMAYATGPCMCEDVLRKPFTGDHICEAVKAVFSGRVRFNGEDDQIAGGITVHRVGGHSKGLQVVRVKTATGWMCLASDATHYYENFLTRTPFPIVVDVEEMLRGYDRIQALTDRPEMVIPGHDPLVTELYPQHGTSGFVWRLDVGPVSALPEDLTAG